MGEKPVSHQNLPLDCTPKGPDEKGCWLESEHHQCCCACTMHLEDKFHCAQHPKLRETSGGNCICSFHKGWICIGFHADGIAHSDWDEHSIGCEMFTRKAAPQVPGSGASTGTDGEGAVSPSGEPLSPISPTVTPADAAQ